MKKQKIFTVITEAISLLILAGLAVYLANRWNSIPDTIPFHFNASGAADGWGAKRKIIIMPVMAGMLYLLLTGVSAAMTFMSNMKTNSVTDAMLPSMENMIRVQKIEVMLLFFYITYCEAEAISMSSAFLPLILAVIFGTMAVFVVWTVLKSRRNNQ